MQSSFLVKMNESKKPRKYKPEEKPFDERKKKKKDYSDARRRKRGEE